MSICPPDIVVAAPVDRNVIDIREICYQSYMWGGETGIVLRFLDAPLSFSSAASVYHPVGIALPKDSCGVTLWEAEERDDRVLFVETLSRAVVEQCINFLREHPGIDCRIIAIADREHLSEQLPEAARLGFSHLPIYAEKNIESTVSYCIVLLNNERANGVGGRKPIARPLPSAAFQRRQDGTDDHIQTPRLLRARGGPLTFSRPLTAHGFRLSSRAAQETPEGILVSKGVSDGAVIYGPYLPVNPGRYEAVAHLRQPSVQLKFFEAVRGRAAGTLCFDVYVGSIDKVLGCVDVAASELGSEPARIELAFEVPDGKSPLELELRMHQRSNRSFLVEAFDLSWLQ